MIELDDALDNGVISGGVYDSIVKECPACGSELVLTDSARQLYCPNPRCNYKIAARLEAMAKLMKVDGWGDSACEEVCRHFGLKSPFQVFLLDKKVADGADCDVSAFSKKVEAICDMSKRNAQLWEVVKYAGIPSVENIAYKIFNGYTSMEEAYADIEKYQVSLIAEKLGQNSSSGVMAVNIYNTLMQYKAELMFGEKEFNIVTPAGEDLYIVITGGVYGFKNKTEFIAYLNNRYSEKLNVIQMGNVSSSIDVLIADGDTNSHKFVTASAINEKYADKGISCGEFSVEQIGTYKHETDLHPIGEKVLITSSEDLIKKLDSIYG